MRTKLIKYENSRITVTGKVDKINKKAKTICIQNITSDSITIIDYEEIYFLRFSESFTNLTFADGAPFGVKVEY